MKYKLSYADKVVKFDIPRIGKPESSNIHRDVERKLTLNPQIHGKPLRFSLAGFRTLRVGNYRVIFTIAEDTVWIIAISHRKGVYELAKNRVGMK